MRRFHDVGDPARLRASLELLAEVTDDRDRNRWLPAAAFAYATIAHSSIAITSAFYGISLPDAADTTASATLAVPDTWINGTLSATAYVGNNAAAAGDLRLTMRLATIAAAAAGASTLIYEATTASPSQNQIKLVASTSTHAVDANKDLILLNVTRLGTHVADTLAGTAVLLGALITYTPS